MFTEHGAEGICRREQCFFQSRCTECNYSHRTILLSKFAVSNTVVLLLRRLISILYFQNFVKMYPEISLIFLHETVIIKEKVHRKKEGSEDNEYAGICKTLRGLAFHCVPCVKPFAGGCGSQQKDL